MVILVFKSKDEIRKYCLRVSVISLLIYLLALYPLAYLAEGQMISRDWPVKTGTLYGFMTVPFSLLKPSFWKSDGGKETSEHKVNEGGGNRLPRLFARVVGPAPYFYR
jgi:hypothetical protein